MITAYEGRQGSGKTACAVLDAFERVKRTGGAIYTNMRSLRYPADWKGKKYDIFHVQSFEELKRCVRGVVLLDEAHVWFFSRQWSKFPYDLLFFWSQARKRQLEIIYTVQDLERIDTLIRDLTDEVIRFKRLWSGLSVRWRREGIAKKWSFDWFQTYRKAFKKHMYDSWEVVWFPLENFENFKVGREFIDEIESRLYENDKPYWWVAGSNDTASFVYKKK